MPILQASLSPGANVTNTLWWTGDQTQEVLEPQQSEASAKLRSEMFKKDQKKTQNEIMDVAKKQHMNTDVKKAVF